MFTEPVPTPPLTLYETFFKMVSNAVDKATFAKVTDEDIKYDTAYVELMHAVEEAMEIPVIGVREDIAELLQLAYYVFEKNMDERDRIGNIFLFLLFNIVILIFIYWYWRHVVVDWGTNS